VAEVINLMTWEELLQASAKGYDDWFHSENTGDKRSKYMDELSLVV
jgi:hypothetical protein